MARHLAEWSSLTGRRNMATLAAMPSLTRFVIAGDYVAGFRDAIAAQRPDLELRVKRLADITAEDLAWAQGFIGFRRPALPDWGRVRWIHSIGAGVDGLLAGGVLPAEILLTKSSEDFGPAIGEWCLTRALAVNQHLAALQADQAARHWNREREPVMLRGQRVLIAGTGAVGRGIARAFAPLGALISGLSRSGDPVAGFDRVGTALRFAEFVREADWLILALPNTADTRAFLDRSKLAQCHGVYLMNVGRGAVVDEAALPEALDRGWIRGAALDVFEREPLAPESPLWSHPKVVISPHISGPSTVAATAAGFLDCLAQVERGVRPSHTVDPKRGY